MQAIDTCDTKIETGTRGPAILGDKPPEQLSHHPLQGRWWSIAAYSVRYDSATHTLRALHALMQLFDGRVCCFFVQGEGTIPQHLLRKYIMYARNNVRPQLHNIDQDKVSLLRVGTFNDISKVSRGCRDGRAHNSCCMSLSAFSWPKSSTSPFT